MTITPTGSPAWLRTAAHTHYGGNVDKTNYQSQGVVNARTDVGAAELCRMAEDLAACVRVAPFARMLIQCNDSSPAAPTITFCGLMTGIRTTSYEGNAAPSGFPSAARNGNGDVTITFASTYADAYSVSGAFAPTMATADVLDSAECDAPSVCSGQTVRVRAFNNSGALSDPMLSVVVW